MVAPNYYEVLGIPVDAEPIVVRRAYLRLARQLHPDFHTTASPTARAAVERQMQQVNEAWTALGDEDRRRAYDRSRREEQRSAWTPGRSTPDFEPIDPDDDPVDPRDLPDVGIPGTEVPRWQQLLPVSLLAVALASFALGLTVSVRALLAVGVLALLGAMAGFLLTPLLAVLRGYERDPQR
jgi:curved DNA-binding protein CbpA